MFCAFSGEIDSGPGGRRNKGPKKGPAKDNSYRLTPGFFVLEFYSAVLTRSDRKCE